MWGWSPSGARSPSVPVLCCQAQLLQHSPKGNLQPASWHGESPELQPPPWGILGSPLGSLCTGWQVGGTCWVAAALLRRPAGASAGSSGGWRASRPRFPLPAPAFALHRCSRHPAPVIPIFLTSEFAAEAGQHLLKICFFFSFLFKLTFHAEQCQGPGGQRQAMVWGLCKGAPLGSATASVSPPVKVCPGRSCPNHPPPLRGPGVCVLLGLSWSHHVLQLLFCQAKLGTPNAVFQGSAPKAGSRVTPETSHTLQVGWCWDAAGCSEQSA